MPITPKTRKPVDKLTMEDFDVFHVWEYATDEEGDDEPDETWVRPVKQALVRRGEYSQLVAATFRTSADRELRGFMIVTTAKKMVEITPGSILSSRLYLVLPGISRREAEVRDLSWSIHAREELCRRLRTKEDAVFPLAYSLDTLIAGEKAARSGSVE
jgi:hypothetical protein